MIGRCGLTILIFILLSLSGIYTAKACSSYKVSAHGTTVLGGNYDTWFVVPRIWFETNGIMAAFTGANNQTEAIFAPQAGMNQYGLAFVSMATAPPPCNADWTGRKSITSRAQYLKDILHHCKNVDEVQAYIEQYNHSVLANDIFLYTDKSGRYLVVEPCTTYVGNDPQYVLANFCPSTITDYGSIKQQRYQNGVAFLSNKADTTLAFCTALSDTMHVCRPKVGDGTLLTTIWNTNSGIVTLYFYHNYHEPVQFNLADEFAKGDHVLEIPPLFASNAEFEKLLSFKTTLNSPFISRLLMGGFGLFLFSALAFFVSFVLKAKNTPLAYVKLLLVALSLILAYYLYALSTEVIIFYSDAPYQHYQPSLLSTVGYIPFLMLLLIVPLLMFNQKAFRSQAWGRFATWLFALNNLAYSGLVMLCLYWGFYDVF